jgi:endonuclease YncB( thermonuclease family)
VLHTKKSFAQGRSKSTRYYSLVQIDGRYLHEILLSEGLARNKGTIVGLPTGEKARAYAATLQKLEDRARLERKGVWANHDPAKRVLNSPL